jgi:glycosyltransferase involved in cell wall biosynthesis
MDNSMFYNETIESIFADTTINNNDRYEMLVKLYNNKCEVYGILYNRLYYYLLANNVQSDFIIFILTKEPLYLPDITTFIDMLVYHDDLLLFQYFIDNKYVALDKIKIRKYYLSTSLDITKYLYINGCKIEKSHIYKFTKEGMYHNLYSDLLDITYMSDKFVKAYEWLKSINYKCDSDAN